MALPSSLRSLDTSAPARCKRTAVDDPLWSSIACNRWIGSIKLWSFPTASDWAPDNAICRRLVNLSILMDVPQSLIYPHSAQGLDIYQICWGEDFRIKRSPIRNASSLES